MMTHEEAIRFLQLHQPMPDTQIPCENGESAQKMELLLKQWNDVLDFFMEHPSEESIPLFFNSLGDEDGLGVYQSLTHYFPKFPPEVVIPYFKMAFRSPSPVIRAAAADYALDVDSGAQDFIEAMLPLLSDSDSEVRLSAINTLSSKVENGLFDWHKCEEFFKHTYDEEMDKDIRELYESIFAS